MNKWFELQIINGRFIHPDFNHRNHIVPYRGDWSVRFDPYFKLFLIFADHFDEFFRERGGFRFNLNGLVNNRKIVKDWDEIVSNLGCESEEGKAGYIGIHHPLKDHISGDMCSKFNLIWVPHKLAQKIMILGFLP